MAKYKVWVEVKAWTVVEVEAEGLAEAIDAGIEAGKDVIQQAALRDVHVTKVFHAEDSKGRSAATSLAFLPEHGAKAKYGFSQL